MPVDQEVNLNYVLAANKSVAVGALAQLAVG